MKIRKIIKSITHSFDIFFDLYRYSHPIKTDEYMYAFIVHPRDLKDVKRKFFFFRILPESLSKLILRKMLPVSVSKITGLHSQITGKPIMGYMVSITLTAAMMLEDRDLANKRIVQAIKLAENKGCKIVALGGLVSSVSHGGLLIKDKIGTMHLTTGHAYTGYNVTQTAISLAEKYNYPKDTLVAIVGATGSIGALSTQILIKRGYTNFLLVDVDRKKDRFADLESKIRSLGGDVRYSITSDMSEVKNAKIVITATNAKEAVIRNEHVSSGTIIVDDAQPSDVSDEVLKRDDVLTVEAGVVHTPNIVTHFNMGLKNRTDNFCCMAELLILAADEWKEDYVIHRATLEDVDNLIPTSQKLGFRIGEYQNRMEKIPVSKLESFSNYI